MASTLKYIGSPREYCEKTNPIPSGIHSWDGDLSFGENLSKYPVVDQLRCALDQILAISYYNVFYGRGCHELVNEFIDEFIQDVKTRVLPICAREFKEGVFAELTTMLSNLVVFNTTYQWNFHINLTLLRDFINNVSYVAAPTAWYKTTQDAFVPFVMFMNKKIDPDYVKFDKPKLSLIGFFIDDYNWHGRPVCSLYPRAYPIGVSFLANETPLDKGHPYTILSYLSHFDLTQAKFDKLIGIIGEIGLHNDMTRNGLNQSQRLASYIRVHCMGLGNISGAFGDYKPFGFYVDKYGVFKTLVAFIRYAHEAYGTVAEDKNLVVNLFQGLAETKEQKDTVAYIREHGGSASADQLKASQECFGTGIEALTFISQRPSLLSAQSQEAGSVKAEEAGTTPKDNPEEGKTQGKTEESKTETQEKKDEGDDKKSESTDDDDTRQDNPGTDDNLDDDDLDMGETSSTDDNNLGNSDTPGGATEPSTVNTPLEEPQVDTSDTTGFVFKSIPAEAETIDSVLFKEEMSSYLSNIIANPPDDLGPQSLATIKTLLRHWLFCLSIETIMGIVGSCIKHLPESLIKLNTKLYGVNNNE